MALGMLEQHTKDWLQKFREEIGKSMEVYMDDMLVKRKRSADHITDLGKTFDILRHYKMKLNAQSAE